MDLDQAKNLRNRARDAIASARPKLTGDDRAFLAQRAELGRLLIETRRALQQILDLDARREDGLARLMAASRRAPKGPRT